MQSDHNQSCVQLLDEFLMKTIDDKWDSNEYLDHKTNVANVFFPNHEFDHKIDKNDHCIIIDTC